MDFDDLCVQETALQRDEQREAQFDLYTRRAWFFLSIEIEKVKTQKLREEMGSLAFLLDD